MGAEHSEHGEALADIEGYLARHEQKTLVRFALVGSVDDGKSTLIGRLLHDTHGIYEDQLASVQAASKKRGDTSGEIDFSLFTDGLKAEREQGITIDVAYRYFTTEARRGIIADTPGHEQYTRNMATGASTADMAVILLDARLGVLPQSRRHATIASLLGIHQLLVAVNKMDLCGYAEERYRELVADFQKVAGQLRFAGGVHFVPVSAKRGDNVVTRSKETPWYEGPTLLGLLDTLPISPAGSDSEPLRFAVQTVLRPHLDYRGFAGYLARGTARPGDRVRVLPSGRETTIAGVDLFGASFTHASAPLSVTLRLADEVDVSRGEMIASAAAPPVVSTELEATLVWLSEAPYDAQRKLLLKHTSRWVPARIATVLGALSLSDGELVSRGQELQMNEIARCKLQLARPVFCDPYVDWRLAGACFLGAALSNATVPAGTIVSARATSVRRGAGRPSAAERAERLGHRALLVRIPGGKDRTERALFDRGLAVLALEGAEATPALVPRLIEAGLCVVVTGMADEEFAVLAAAVPEGSALDLHNRPGDPVEHVVLAALKLTGHTGGGGI